MKNHKSEIINENAPAGGGQKLRPSDIHLLIRATLRGGQAPRRGNFKKGENGKKEFFDSISV